MTKAYSRFLTAFFCIFLGGLLVWHILLPDRETSETENRTLAQVPEFSWAALVNGSFTDDVEEYFADQFPLRDGWTGLKARTEQLIGKSEFNGVYLCGDTLISKVETPDAELVKKNLSYVTRLAEKTDIPVYLGLIPSAAEVWKEKLPAGAESWDQTQLLDAAAETPTGHVAVGGTSNMLSYPESSDVEKARGFLSLSETRDKLAKIIADQGEMAFTVRIGPETGVPEMADCSIVTATYHSGKGQQGTIGVIGPTRMQYSKVLSILGTMGQQLSRMLQEDDHNI